MTKIWFENIASSEVLVLVEKEDTHYVATIKCSEEGLSFNWTDQEQCVHTQEEIIQRFLAVKNAVLKSIGK